MGACYVTWFLLEYNYVKGGTCRSDFGGGFRFWVGDTSLLYNSLESRVYLSRVWDDKVVLLVEL